MKNNYFVYHTYNKTFTVAGRSGLAIIFIRIRFLGCSEMTTKRSIQTNFYKIQIELLTDDEKIEKKKEDIEEHKKKGIKSIDELREMVKEREKKKKILSKLEEILELDEEECVSIYRATIDSTLKNLPTDRKVGTDSNKILINSDEKKQFDESEVNDEDSKKSSKDSKGGSSKDGKGGSSKDNKGGSSKDGKGKSSIINSEGKGSYKYEYTLYDQIPLDVKEILEISDDTFPSLESKSDTIIKNKETIWNCKSSSIMEKSYETTIKDYGKGGSIDKKDLKYERAVKKMTDELNSSSYGHNEKDMEKFSLKMIIHACNSIIKICENYDNSTHPQKKFVYETLYNMLWYNKYPGRITSEDSSFVQKFINEFLNKYPEFIQRSKPIDF